MRRLNFLLLSLLFFQLSFSQSSFKPMKDTTAFKQLAAKMAKETSSIESDFTQVKNLSMISEKIISKGLFCFRKQNDLRWEYTEPYKYVIVINQDKVLIKDGSNKVKRFDMGSNKIFKEINGIMIACINGSVLESDKFSAAYFESDKSYLIELTPRMKSMKESLQRIDLYFDKAVTAVTKLEMIENGGDRTTIDFTNRKINVPIAAENFVLK